jgi:hypothetical protein
MTTTTNLQTKHNELLILMESKITKGNSARTEIDFFKGEKKIGTTILSHGKIIFVNKFI